MDEIIEDSEMRLLLFVDRTPVLLPIKQELSKENLVLFERQSAEEAIQAVRTLRFDLVFIDLMIPGDFSGYDLCKHFKRNDQTEEIPVFLFCDHPLPLEVTRDYFFELQAERLILPPWDPTSICRQICRTLWPP